MGIFDDDAPRPSKLHELGQSLDGLSVGDLDDRIAALRSEIARLEEDKRRKESTMNSAEMAFKPTMGGN